MVTGVGRSSVVAATRVYAFLADNVNDIFHLETLSVTENTKRRTISEPSVRPKTNKQNVRSTYDRTSLVPYY